MLKKSYFNGGKTCRVTFTVPARAGARSVHLCGEFNDWDEASHPLSRRKDGRFSASVTLKPGREYRFRYLLDRGQWENDKEADGFVPNPYGTEDSLLRV